MQLESFVARSLGRWRSMRSGHSLAFQQFEDVRSSVLIESIEPQDPLVLNLLKDCTIRDAKPVHPFRMEWNAESDWEPADPNALSPGEHKLGLRLNDTPRALEAAFEHQMQIAETSVKRTDDADAQAKGARRSYLPRGPPTYLPSDSLPGWVCKRPPRKPPTALHCPGCYPVAHHSELNTA